MVAGSRDVAAVNVAAMVPSLGAVGAGAGRPVRASSTATAGRAPGAGDEPAQPGDSGELLAFLAWHVAASLGAAGYWPAQRSPTTPCAAGAPSTPPPP